MCTLYVLLTILEFQCLSIVCEWFRFRSSECVFTWNLYKRIMQTSIRIQYTSFENKFCMEAESKHWLYYYMHNLTEQQAAFVREWKKDADNILLRQTRSLSRSLTVSMYIFHSFSSSFFANKRLPLVWYVGLPPFPSAKTEIQMNGKQHRKYSIFFEKREREMEKFKQKGPQLRCIELLLVDGGGGSSSQKWD